MSIDGTSMTGKKGSRVVHRRKESGTERGPGAPDSLYHALNDYLRCVVQIIFLHL